MTRTIRTVIASVCALACLLIPSTPAHAVWVEPAGVHGFFDRFTWGGAVWNTKSFYLIDRLGTGAGSTTLRQGLVAYVNNWNAELQGGGWYGELPAIAYVRDDAGAGVCTNGGRDAEGPTPLKQINGAQYSYVLACMGSPNGGVGLSRGSTQSVRLIRGAGIFPYAYCKGAFALNVAQSKSCWAHEIGHLMGIPHNNAPLHLMNTDASGIYAAQWYPGDVWSMLLNLYPPMNQD